MSFKAKKRFKAITYQILHCLMNLFTECGNLYIHFFKDTLFNFFQTNLILNFCSHLEDSNTNKRNPSDTEAVTVGGTVGSSVIVVIGVILAFLAIRYA